MTVDQFLKTIEQRHAGVQGGFGLLANVKNIAAREPFEVAPGIFFRPAREDEALTFSQLLALATVQITPFVHHRNPYETYVEQEVIAPDQTRTHIHELPAGRHRYCVAEFTGTNATLHRVLEASVLTSSELELGINIHINVAGFILGLSLGYQQRILEEASCNDECLLSLELSDLKELQRVYVRFQQHNDEGIGLLPALSQFKELDAITVSSPLRFLGYMAILESLITHQPKPIDPYDSLTRQVRQKMLLLGRRSHLKPPYDLFEPDCKPAKIWTTLYDYRSAIAHGKIVDFNTGDLKMFGNARKALDFIRGATVAVMRHALDEPELLLDLRAC